MSKEKRKKRRKKKKKKQASDMKEMLRNSIPVIQVEIEICHGVSMICLEQSSHCSISILYI